MNAAGETAGDGTEAPHTERPSADHLLRTMQQGLVQLSGMADQKANIVLGASLIMVTIIVSVSSSNGLTLSLATLGLFTVGSSISALLAVMPVRRSDKTHVLSPLYFGDAAELSFDEYRGAMYKILDEPGGVYDTIIADNHRHAALLQLKKYRYLRYSYLMFIVGLFATSIAIAIERITDSV